MNAVLIIFQKMSNNIFIHTILIPFPSAQLGGVSFNDQ